MDDYYVWTEKTAGGFTEHFSTKALISDANHNIVMFEVPNPTAIKSRNNNNSRFANSGNRTWITDVKLRYPDGSTSTKAYVEGVVIDTKRFSDAMDFFYFGIPKRIAHKVLTDAVSKTPFCPMTDELDKNSSDNYVWTTSKLEKIREIGLFTAEKTIKHWSSPKSLLLDLKKANRCPVFLAVVQLKLKCTCKEHLGYSEALALPWSLGGTLEAVFVNELTSETSPDRRKFSNLYL
uniref:Uncharacterized protein n=1 Tax=Spongospora subterranea TaxID=70186 RepID=A0A0H5R506_9EUKA|eukprot:CRZ08966.1 hypothetical protein [Spongospora subterranea]